MYLARTSTLKTLELLCKRKEINSKALLTKINLQ